MRLGQAEPTHKSGITSVSEGKFQKVDANPRSNEVRALNSLNILFFFGSFFFFFGNFNIPSFGGSKIAFPIQAGYSFWPSSTSRSIGGLFSLPTPQEA